MWSAVGNLQGKKGVWLVGVAGGCGIQGERITSILSDISDPR